MIKQLRLFTLPFSWLYGLITYIRNKLYDCGLLRSVEFDLPVICVGNLAVGGSGKTPVTEYLVNLLEGNKIAILSRGYGRKTTGFILASKQSTAAIIGDEPMQYYNKFADVTVAVCEDRVRGIQLLSKDHDLIILDDAFQHRSVKPGFNILLFEFGALLNRQFLLPAGNLREYFSNYRRADVVLVTKTPAEATVKQRDHCKNKFSTATWDKLFFSQIGYQELTPVFKERLSGNANDRRQDALVSNAAVFLLTGIANPRPLVDYLNQRCTALVHHEYGDHYQFVHADILKLVAAYNACPNEEKIIVTTEKDTQRLLDGSLKDLLVDLPVFYLPIKIEVREEDKVTFDQKILNYVSSARRNDIQ